MRDETQIRWLRKGRANLSWSQCGGLAALLPAATSVRDGDSVEIVVQNVHTQGSEARPVLGCSPILGDSMSLEQVQGSWRALRG
jgi:hypothetical protein